MPEPSKKGIEKATIWALFGILATVVVGLPAIYFSVHEKRPHISYEIVGDSKVLDVHQPVKDLEIRYRGEDIYALKKDLSILTITVRNDGETHIRQSDFDELMPWGLQINNGQIVDAPKLVSCNSDYIQNNISLRATTNNLVVFQKIIFERDKFFTVQLQVLHHSDNEPEIDVVGKIAGIDAQVVVDNLKTSEAPSFWAKVFYGPLTVQLARVFVYVAGTILLIMVTVIFIASITELISKASEKRIERATDAYLGPLFVDRDQKTREGFKSLLSLSRADVGNLKNMKAFLGDTNAVNPILEKVRRNNLSDEELKQLPGMLQKAIQQKEFFEAFARRNRLFPEISLADLQAREAILRKLDNSTFLPELLTDSLPVRENVLRTIDQLILHLEASPLPGVIRKKFFAKTTNNGVDSALAIP